MDFFDVLTAIGGLCLFLFGMNIMGQALESRAGSGLRNLLGKLTTNKFAGFLTGLGVTAIIQSSSATTVMVVGFVNSGLMSLSQSINVIMGANVGTTITSWLLSLAGIEGSNFFVTLLKPTSFSPILALIGVVLYVFMKNEKRKDEGLIFLGFATLMFGMDTMSTALEGLKSVPEFVGLFTMFENPLMGVLVGIIVTAIIQSSSASVGILQALASTGAISIGATVPIIMGQNIGTCATSLISSVGANKNAKRASFVHFLFNIIGTTVWLIVFVIIKYAVSPMILSAEANAFTIAVVHTLFNLLSTALLFPCSKLLEKIANKVIKDNKQPEEITLLDDRLLKMPAMALTVSRKLAVEMANLSITSLQKSISLLDKFDKTVCEEVRKSEEKTDYYEDILGTYLLKLSSNTITDTDLKEAGKLIKVIGDLERLSDHSVNIVESAEELNEKGIVFSEEAKCDLKLVTSALNEILSLTLTAFTNSNVAIARDIDPLEEIIDELKVILRDGHITRMQLNKCTVGAGFIWSDLLTNFERVSDHCSNIASAVMDLENMNYHEHLKSIEESNYYKDKLDYYSLKYLPKSK